MAATAVGYDSIETEVQAHMALHPDDDIFLVRSAIAMRAMINEAPPAAIKQTSTGGRFLDLPLVRGVLSLVGKKGN